jgi:hypothetical protein
MKHGQPKPVAQSIACVQVTLSEGVGSVSAVTTRAARRAESGPRGCACWLGQGTDPRASNARYTLGTPVRGVDVKGERGSLEHKQWRPRGVGRLRRGARHPARTVSVPVFGFAVQAPFP